MPEALFRRDGDTFTPTAFTTGPWRPDAMHGGPPAALVGRAVDAAAPGGFHVARVTVELERPVPLVALRVATTVRPVSRRVLHADVSVATTDGATVVSGRGLLLAREPMPPPAWSGDEEPAVDFATARRVNAAAFATGAATTTYHRDAVEHRMLPGSDFGAPGPATSWVRMLHPLVAGEETAPVARVLAVADFGSGISAVYDQGAGVGLINADLHVSLLRAPEGDWVRLQAETRIDRSGSALATTMLGDMRGGLGVATQSLLGLRF